MKKISKILILVLLVFSLLLFSFFLVFHFFLKDFLIQEATKRLKAQKLVFKDIDFSILPHLGIEIKDFELKTKKYKLFLKDGVFVLRIRPLIHKKLEVEKFILKEPNLDIYHRISSKEEHIKTKKVSFWKNFPENFFDILDKECQKLPKARIDIEDGIINYYEKDTLLWKIFSLNGSLNLKHEFLNFSLNGKSPAIKKFKISGKIWLKEHLAEGLVNVEHLNLNQAVFLANKFPKALLKSDLNLNLSYRYEENTWKLGFQFTSSCLATPLKTRGLLFECAALLGKAQINKEGYHIDIQNWVMKEPCLSISGFFEKKKDYRFSFKIKEADWGEIRFYLSNFFPKNKGIQKLCEIVESGKVKDGIFKSKAETLKHLFKIENIYLNGYVYDGTVRPPKPKIKIKNLSGKASLDRGKLLVKKAKGISNEVYFDQGFLLLNIRKIKDHSSPLHLKLNLKGDIRNALEIVKKLPPPKKLEDLLIQKSEIEGEISSYIELKGKNLRNLHLYLIIKPINIFLKYENFPFVLKIDNGKIIYQNKEIYLNSINIFTQKSQILQLISKFILDKKYLEIESLRGIVNADELKTIILFYPQLTKCLKVFDFEGENIKIEKLSYKGTIKHEDIIKNLICRLTFKDFIFKIPYLPGRINIEYGGIEYKGDMKFLIEPSSINILDSKGIISGNISIAPLSINLKGKDTLAGKELLNWIFNISHLSKDYFPRYPLILSDFDLKFENKENLALKAQIEKEDHIARVTFNKKKNQLFFDIELLTQDTFKFQLKKYPNKIYFRALGNITDSQIKEFLIKNPFVFQEIRSRIEGHIFLRDILKSEILGNISVSRFRLPFKKFPLWIEELDIDAKKNLIWIQRFEFDLDGTSFETQGKCEITSEYINIEGSAYAPILFVDDLAKIFKTSKNKDNKEKHKEKFSKIDLVAKIDLQIDSIIYKHFEFPLKGTIFYRPKNFKLIIEESSFCNIPIWGEYAKIDNNQSLKLSFNQPNGDLAKTYDCLLKSKVMLEGPYELKGYLRTEGRKLFEKSDGNFRFVSKKGHIYKFGTLAKILVLLSPLDVFQGHLPDLSKEGMDYKLLKIKGHFHKHYAVIDSWRLEAPGFRIFASGKIDLLDQDIDFTAFVSPFETVDSLVSKVPLIGWVLTGKSKTFFAVPVKIYGKLGDPSVTPLSPTAVGEKALGIIKRTFQLPVKIILPKKKEPSLDMPKDGK